MKAAIILVLVVCYAESRKIYQPIDKNANLAFINMESGGVRTGPTQKPGSQPALSPVVVAPVPNPAPVSPTPAKPAAVVTQKPTAVTTQKVLVVTPPVPKQPNNQIKPVPVNPTPAATPISTPGPGTVKQLVNFYDSQGKASAIRPYSYSQAVKQG